MKVISTSIPDLMIVENTSYIDERGVFSRFYCECELTPVIGSRRIMQINYSRTATIGAIRGLHFQQPPHAEMKLVRCLKGKVWDVAVDLRESSSTFLQWHSEELTPANSRMMVIPEGFAHGFQALEPESELLYLHTQLYVSASERGLSHLDPRLKIDWPLAVTDLSLRDASHEYIEHNFQGIQL